MQRPQNQSAAGRELAPKWCSCSPAPTQRADAPRLRKCPPTAAQVSGMRSWQPCTRTVSSPFPRHMIGRKARPRPAFLAVLGLLCFNGKGALGLATHDVVAPRHALRAAALCDAAQHAEIGIEAALIQLDRLPASEFQRGAMLRYVAEASLEALEAEWRRTAAWIDDAREQLASASARAADLTSEHVAGVTGAFCWTLLYCCLVKVRV